MSVQKKKRINSKLALTGVFALMAMGAVGCTTNTVDGTLTTPTPTLKPTNITTSPTPTTEGTNTNSKLKDGTYTAQGSYFTPGGSESIGVTLTIADEKVTSVSIEQKPVSSDARRYQSFFASGVSSQVVGKNIKDINLGRVNGSSLTSEGFNSAVDIIEALAK